MPSKSGAILADATSGFRNGLRRMASGPLSDRPRARGKENYPPCPPTPQHEEAALPSPAFAHGFDPHRWDAIDGRIVIKVAVPATDDLWRCKVPQGVSLRGFRAKVELKVGFAVVFAEGGRRVASEEAFRRWVAGRVKDGRNRPLVALKKTSPSGPYPSTPTSPLSPQLQLSPSPMSPMSPNSPYTPFQ